MLGSWGTGLACRAVISAVMNRRIAWMIAAGCALAAGCTDGGQFLPTQVVFTSDRGGTNQIYIMKANGDDVRQLTFGTSVQDATMSAAGTKIAYTKEVDGLLRIFLNNNEGTNEQLRFGGIRGAAQHSPKYHKSGGRLVFVVGLAGGQEVWRMDSNGGDQRQLTNNEFANFMPNWTSGTDVVFVSNRSGNNEIWIMNGDGSDPVQLTNDGGDDTMPACTPTGNGIVFSSNRTGVYQLYTMDNEGANLQQLTSSPGDKFGASYSMDGDKIFFYSNVSGNNEIYSIDTDGTGETNLTNHAASDTKVGTWVAP